MICIHSGGVSDTYYDIRNNTNVIQLLSNENKQRYVRIANERKNIYLKGFGLGFVISLLALFILK